MILDACESPFSALSYAVPCVSKFEKEIYFGPVFVSVQFSWCLARVPAPAKFTTRTVRKIGKILGGDTGPPEWNQKPRGAGGMGASGPVGTRPDTAKTCDNLARLTIAGGLKWGQVGAQLEHPAPCCLAGCAGTL